MLKGDVLVNILKMDAGRRRLLQEVPPSATLGTEPRRPAVLARRVIDGRELPAEFAPNHDDLSLDNVTLDLPRRSRKRRSA